MSTIGRSVREEVEREGGGVPEERKERDVGGRGDKVSSRSETPRMMKIVQMSLPLSPLHNRGPIEN